jgi:hypothetical protein
VISLLFVIESALKIIVMGFVIGKNTYLRDPFNILDFIIAISSILNFILDRTGGINIAFVKAFRALRAIRPLRIVS